jgi:hypothetical protein
MDKSRTVTYILTTLFCFAQTNGFTQPKTLDAFEDKEGWSFIRSDGVAVKLSNERGLNGNAIRFDYDFTKGTGYGGIQKLFPLDLPDNYEFTFYLKSESPSNNLEVKFVDSTGKTVWWAIYRDYDFPKEWKKMRIRKRHISFAWGPTNDQYLKRVDRIEFTISSSAGGKGTIWIDDLKFEPLEPAPTHYPRPQISASSSARSHTANYTSDSINQTWWQSKGVRNEYLLIDFKTHRELGGLQIDWHKGLAPKSFDILLSGDGKTWEHGCSVRMNRSDRSFIRLPEAEARYIKVKLHESISGKGFGADAIEYLDVKNSLTKNDFLRYIARNSPRGDYPRYFLEEASYWTVSGVNNDAKEALLNEDGMVEVDKARFSIEPMVKVGDSLYCWSNVVSTQSIGFSGNGGFRFQPSVSWQVNDLDFTTSVASYGEANKNSKLAIRYSFENRATQGKDIEFYLLVRPYQVNPYYQFLNMAGGVGTISSMAQFDSQTIVVDNKVIVSQKKFDSFSAWNFDAGSIVNFIREGDLPQHKQANDPNGMAKGVLKYKIRLGPKEKTGFYVVVPFHEGLGYNVNFNSIADDFSKSVDLWSSKVNHIEFNLPESGSRIVNTYRANLAYILINRDRAGIQPGSRSYERSWIRDGALTSSALLKSGIVHEVKDFIRWYSNNLFENGKVPCVVDSRGPDPVPENDSHGEYIYLVREYFNFTRDTAFLRQMNVHVLKAVEYIELLIAQRSTDHFRAGNDSVRAYYGLVPESISHEGYSAKPMHSYWDNFFTMKGLKDAAEIQRILGEEESFQRIKRVRDTFRENLYSSLNLAMKNRKIDYIPGCVELGDFDATSTTIALTPCTELANLPKPQVYNTFDRYFEFFRNRRDGKVEWENYTPYENRLIGSYIMLDQPDRAHELIDFFLNDQRPRGWYHWAEVVWRDYRTPRFIGDMPHTWVGSDFINAIRSMFVYENEHDQSLVVGAALYQDWIDSPDGMSVQNLPTYFGELSYSIKKEGISYRFSISGDMILPANGIKIRNFNGSKLPVRVTVNGVEVKEFNGKEIPVKEFPAEVIIMY